MAPSLENDLSCTVCWEIFTDPHVLTCGHSFCRQCIGDHQPCRTCPVCLRCTHQNPVPNLVLRSTCESYRRKTLEEEEDEERGGLQCPLHGLKIRFFCKDHQEVLCKECTRRDHRRHNIQLLTQAVQQHKDQIRAALLPAEKALESLRKSSGLESRVIKCIKSQAEQAERQMKAEFEKLHQFLRVEEEARRNALRADEQRKRAELEELVGRDLQALTDIVTGVEKELQNDDVTFMRNFARVLSRAQSELPKQRLGSECLIPVAKHVGNLTFRVWEKMKDVCPCYPVILDPNSASPNMTVSADLTAVSCLDRRYYSSNPLLDARWNFQVLGSEALTSGYNCWDVEVGDGTPWELGVCGHMLDSPWGLGNGLYTLGSEQVSVLYDILGRLINANRSPRTIRVKLEQRNNLNGNPCWSLTITERGSGLVLRQFNNIPFRRDLHPFLSWRGRETPLGITPVKVNVTLEKESVSLFWFLVLGVIMGVIFLIFCLFVMTSTR